MNGIRLAKRNKRGLINFVGTFYKYLFGTFNQEDKVELETKINNLSENSVKANELNQIIDAVNKGIEVINTLNLINEGEEKLAIITFNLQEFTEYIKDIKLGMQLTRLGIFNPKFIKHNPLSHMNSEKIFFNSVNIVESLRYLAVLCFQIILSVNLKYLYLSSSLVGLCNL